MTLKHLISFWNSSFIHFDTVQQETLKTTNCYFLSGIFTGPNSLCFSILVQLKENQMVQYTFLDEIY